MAKDRIEPCIHYVCIGKCEKNRVAEHSKYCQKCDLYLPRVRKKHLNGKKIKIDRIRKNEYHW